MAAKKRSVGGVNKSGFIREQLQANPNITAKEVAAAWAATGHADKFNPVLYYQVRRASGNTGRPDAKRRGRKPGRPAGTSNSAPTAKPTPADAKENGYAKIEAELDALVAKAEELRDSKLANELRSARRHASSKLV